MQANSIRIEPQVFRGIEEEGREEKRKTEDIINDMLRRHLLLRSMRQLREVIEPQARDRGYLTDEDIFREVS